MAPARCPSPLGGRHKLLCPCQRGGGDKSRHPGCPLSTDRTKRTERPEGAESGRLPALLLGGGSGLAQGKDVFTARSRAVQNTFVPKYLCGDKPFFFLIY